VVELRVKVEEVGDVDVGRAELVVFLLSRRITGRGVIDSKPLNDELQSTNAVEV
jgi:hypothetical protein